MKTRVPDAATERRLDELREEAALRGRVEGPGLRPMGSPFPTYYGLPLLKQPVWSWEVPLYFFVGGAAGASAVIGVVAQLNGSDQRLVRDARMLAAAGAMLSAPLLISDLGQPKRFLYMLRVLKPQSAMSVGAWTVAAFGGLATGAALFKSNAFGMGAAITGLVMSTYTGVLVGATSIPAWSTHASLLPAHFGASAVASASSLLELRGHKQPALSALATIAAVFETATGAAIELDRRLASEPLRRGTSGTTMRIAGFFSGPVPLLLRLLRKRKAAAASQVLGSLITRIAWVEAGRASARDPVSAMEGRTPSSAPPIIRNK